MQFSGTGDSTIAQKEKGSRSRLPSTPLQLPGRPYRDALSLFSVAEVQDRLAEGPVLPSVAEARVAAKNRGIRVANGDHTGTADHREPDCARAHEPRAAA